MSDGCLSRCPTQITFLQARLSGDAFGPSPPVGLLVVAAAAVMVAVVAEDMAQPDGVALLDRTVARFATAHRGRDRRHAGDQHGGERWCPPRPRSAPRCYWSRSPTRCGGAWPASPSRFVTAEWGRGVRGAAS
jgi:hypothetical protein